MKSAAESILDQQPPMQHLIACSFYVLLIVWVLYVIGTSLTFETMQDRGVPLAGGIMVLVLASIQLVRVVRSDGNPKPEVSDQPTSATSDTPETAEESGSLEPDVNTRISVILALLSYPLLVYLLGFFIATIGYTFLFVWWYTKETKVALKTTVVITVGYVALFFLLLDIHLWDGVLGFI